MVSARQIKEPFSDLALARRSCLIAELINHSENMLTIVVCSVIILSVVL
jgi:hypothetical protein